MYYSCFYNVFTAPLLLSPYDKIFKFWKKVGL